MATNNDIWGTKTDWACPSNAFSGTNEDMKPLIGYFATPPSAQYSQGDLYLGLTTGKFPSSNGFTNEPIDISISYCGLGTESVWSHIEYYMIGEHSTVSNLVNTDDRTITNFAFCYRQSNSYGGLYQTNDTTSNSKLGNRCRWAPYGVNPLELDPSAADTNRNRQVCPYVQLPVRNFVLVPYVRASSSLNENTGSTSGMDITNFVWWDYIDTSKPKNKTTHPYILSITFQPYTVTSHADDVDPVTGKPAVGDNRVTLSIYSGITILSPVSYANGVESDIANPTGTPLGDVYSYYFSRTRTGSSALSGITIFGTSSVGLNDLDYIVQTSNPTPSLQLRWLLRHPNAVLRNMAETANYGWYYLEYYDGLEEWIMHQIACFGLFFTLDKDTAETGALNDEKMYLGVLVDGVGHGDYVHGVLNELQQQWEWDTTNDSSYKPYNPPDIDPNNYNGKMRTHDLVLTDTATQRYALTPTGVYGLLDKLWEIMALADPDEALTDFSVGEFLATNPIDAIVSLQFLPVTGINTGTDTTVKLGTHDTKVDCQTGKTSLRVDCGNYKIFPRFGNSWIDRMTKITLYLPFCGTVNLDPELYMDRSVNVEYLIDLTTGTCTAVVSFIGDGGERVITDTASGSCGMDLPVTGIQQQTLNSQLFNASEQTKQLKVNNAFKGFNSIMNGVSAMNSSNPASSISGLLGAGQDIYNIFQSEKIADYNLQHTMIPTKMIGTSGGLTGAMCEWYPVIIFERPSLPEGFDYFGCSANYAHTEGYACCISGQLSDFSGYTEISSIDLSGFEATATEKNMIRAALAGGVYL